MLVEEDETAEMTERGKRKIRYINLKFSPNHNVP